MSSAGALIYYQNTLRNQLHVDMNNTKIEDFTKIFCEVLYFVSEHSYARKELCEASGGDQVDGSPPAPLARPAPADNV
eukprot:1620730-Pyramimonas_sp.AAC.1